MASQRDALQNNSGLTLLSFPTSSAAGSGLTWRCRIQWGDELAVFLAQARGDLCVYLALAALRRVEHGGPGREMGVLSVDADTFEKQVHVAAVSFHLNEQRAAQAEPPITGRDGATGLYTPAFLTFFSHRWAPIGAANDPKGLNAAHAANLCAIYGAFASIALSALESLTGPD